MNEKGMEREREQELAHERREGHDLDRKHPQDGESGHDWSHIPVRSWNHVNIDLPDFSGGNVSVQLGQLTQAAEPDAGSDTIEATYLFGSDANAMMQALLTGTGVSNMLGPNPPTPESLQAALADPTKQFPVQSATYLGIRLRVWEADGTPHQDFLYGFQAPPSGAGFASFARFTADPGRAVRIEGFPAIYYCWKDLMSTSVPRWSWITDPAAYQAIFTSTAPVTVIRNDPPGLLAAVGNDPGIQIDDASELVKGTGPAVYLVAQGVKHPVSDPGAFAYSGFDWSKVQEKPDSYIEGLADGPAIDWQSPALS